jgi:hypothetical protein
MDALKPALARAVAARNRVRLLLFGAKQAEERGQRMLEQTTRRLEAHADVDEAILAHRAEKFKHAAEEDRNPRKSLALPASLAARERARDEAQSASAAASAAHGALVAEREEAEKALQSAEHTVAIAAAAIQTAKGNQLADQLREDWKAVWRRYDELEGLGAAWIPYPERPRPIQLSAESIRIIQTIAGFDHRQFPGGRNQAAAEFSERYRAELKALIEHGAEEEIASTEAA